MSMDNPQLGLLLGVAAARHEAESSRPWAPEVPEPDRAPHTPRARVPRTRRTLAGALHQLADAITPTSPCDGQPAR
ncbi:hypothetical protein [uncultured Cellulomonas sp.]|uniref:hypothetical protein n=1 Tax=uncultured Cellulomonas sp. TaxID=189682 RepID=UPI0028F0BE47|nr:hypothetical protein [uncultured Cellulomonas sp.]